MGKSFAVSSPSVPQGALAAMGGLTALQSYSQGAGPGQRDANGTVYQNTTTSNMHVLVVMNLIGTGTLSFFCNSVAASLTTDPFRVTQQASVASSEVSFVVPPGWYYAASCDVGYTFYRWWESAPAGGSGSAIGSGVLFDPPTDVTASRAAGGTSGGTGQHVQMTSGTLYQVSVDTLVQVRGLIGGGANTMWGFIAPTNSLAATEAVIWQSNDNGFPVGYSFLVPAGYWYGLAREHASTSLIEVWEYPAAVGGSIVTPVPFTTPNAVSTTRFASTQYQNTTGKPLWVSVSGAGGNGSIRFWSYPTPNSGLTAWQGDATLPYGPVTYDNGVNATAQWFVPNGYYYGASFDAGSLITWYEAEVDMSGSGAVISIDETVVNGTNGSVLFVGSGALKQDNANFFWDDTNNRLGVKTNTPLANIHTTATLSNLGMLITGEHAFGQICIWPNADNEEASIGFFSKADGSTPSTAWVIGQGCWDVADRFTIGNSNGTGNSGHVFTLTRDGVLRIGHNMTANYSTAALYLGAPPGYTTNPDVAASIVRPGNAFCLVESQTNNGMAGHVLATEDTENEVGLVLDDQDHSFKLSLGKIDSVSEMRANAYLTVSQSTSNSPTQGIDVGDGWVGLGRALTPSDHLSQKSHSAFTGSEQNTRTAAVQTTNATQTVLTSMTLADTKVYWLEALIIGRKTDGTERVFFTIRTMAYREGGGAVVGTVDVDNYQFSAGATTWDATFTVSGNDIRVSVTGEAATTINWTCTLRNQGVSGNI